MSSRTSALTCLLATLTLTLCTAGSAAASAIKDTTVDAETTEENDGVILQGEDGASLAGHGVKTVTGDTDPHPTRYKRVTTFLCTWGVGDIHSTLLREACEDHEQQAPELDCPPDAVKLPGLWSSEWDESAGAYGEWKAENPMSCLVATDLQAEAQRAFEVLTIPAPEPSIQPAQWALVNVHSPVSVTAPVHRFSVELLGIPVLLEVTATAFTWDFGDGSAPLVTQDPGRAWQKGDPIPDESWVGHAWTRKGTYPVTMTATWQGRFTLVGTDAWESVAGDVITTSSVGPIEVLEARSQLVDGTLG